MTQKMYVHKENLNYFQRIPVPEDLENWYVVEYDPEYDYRLHIYSPDTGQFVPDVAKLQKLATTSVNKYLEILTANVSSEYSESEQATFDTQYQEALSIRDSTGKATPVLNALASMRGETTEVLAEKVLAKRLATELAHISVLNQRQTLLEDACSVQTPSELEEFKTRLEVIKQST